MAGITDRRVMQLSFENAQFERNIAKSTKSLDELKRAMNFDETSKGLDKFASGLSALRFDRLEENIQRLTDKFTGLGTVSELVLSQIRQKIEHAAASMTRFMDSMTTQQMSAGMEKFDMLNNSVQTIKAATGASEEYVLGVMERLNQYTDETSYNFADMAQNIGKFTSVGIDLKAAERQMEGIANWAARSGAGINEASRAMYNLSQAMGVGKLTLIDWKSIENAGMATKEFKQQLIDAAVAAGTLEKTVDKKTGKTVYKTAKRLGKQIEVTAENMGSTLNKGWATSQALSATLEKYYWEPLSNYDAAEPVLKLNEDQKAAFDKMFEDDEKMSEKEWKTLESMGVWTTETKQKLLDLAVANGKLTKEVDKDGKAIYKAVGKNGKAIEVTLDNLASTLKTGWLDKGLADTATNVSELAKSSFEAAQKCLKFSDVLGAWRDQISTGWMNSWRIIFGDLTESMDFFSVVCEKVANPLSELIELRNGILKSWSDNGGRQSLVTALLGDEEAGVYGLLDTFQSVKDLLYDGFIDFISIFAGKGTALSFKDDEWGMRNLIAYLGATLAEGSKKVQQFVANIRTFFGEEIEVAGKTTTRLEMLQNVIRGVAGIIAIAYTTVKGLAGFISDIMGQLTPSFNAALDFLSTLGLTLYDTSEGVVQAGTIPKFFSDLATTLGPTIGAINEVIGVFFDLLNTILQVDKEQGGTKSFFQSIATTILDMAQKIGKVAVPILHFFRDFIGAFKTLFTGGFSTEALTQFGTDVKTAFNTMITSMPETIQKVVQFFKNAWVTIKSVFTSGFSAESLSNLKGLFTSGFKKLSGLIPQGLKDGAKGVLKKVKTFFEKLWADITGFITKIFSGKPKSLEKVGETVPQALEPVADGVEKGTQNVFTKIIDFFKTLFGNMTAKGSLFDKVKTWFETTFGGVKDFVKSVGGVFNKIITSIRSLFAPTDEAKETFGEWLGKLDWSSILLILGSLTGITLVILAVVKVIALIKSFGETLGDLVDILKNGVKLKFNTEAEKTKSFAEKALIFAAAIGVITACLVVIGKMPLEQAIQGIAGVALIMTGIAVLSKILKKTFEDMKVSNALSMLLGMISISIAVAAVTGAMMKLGKVNPTEWQQMMLGYGIVIMGIWALSEILAKHPIKFEDTSGLLAVAGAVWILVQTMQTFRNIKDPEEWKRMFAGLIGVLVTMGLFMLAVKKLSMAGKGMKEMIALAGAVAILVLALSIIAKLKWEELGKAGVALTGILGLLIGFTWAIHKTSMAGKGMGQVAALAAAIGILVLSLTKIAKLKWEELGKAGAALAGILLILGVFMAATKKLTMAGSGMGQMIALAAAVAVLMLTLIPISKIPLPGLIQAVGAVIVIVGMLALVVYALGKNKSSIKGAGMAGLIALALSVAVLMLALMPLAGLNPEQFKQVIWGVIVVVGMLAVLVAAVSKVDWKGALTSVVLMLSIMGVILVIGAVLHDVQDIPTEKLWSFFGGLAILIAAVGLMSVVAKFAGITGVLLLIGGVAGLIAAILGVVMLLGPGATSALSEMAAYLTLFSGMMETFSANMNSVDEGGIQKASNIIDLLTKLLPKIFEFREGVGSSQALTDTIAYLLIFSDLAGDFSVRMTKVDIASVVKANSFVTQMRAVLDSLADFTYTSNISSFTTAIWDIGTTAESFMSHTSGIGDVSENGALQLIKELSACAGDLDIIAKMNMDTLTSQLTGLGGAMMVYAKGSEEATGIATGEGAPDVAGAVRILTDISTALTENGGFTIPANMPDETALGTFGAQLAALAGALVMFEEAGQGLGGGTENAKAALTYFKNLKSDLVEIDGESLQTAMDAFGSGEGAITPGALETFGKNIEQLGLALKAFAESTTSVDEASGEIKPIDYTKATEALTSMSKLTENLPTFGSITTWVTGQKQSLGQFATDIEELGSALKTFAEKVNGEDDSTYSGLDKAMPVGEDGLPMPTVVSEAIKLVDELANIQKKFEKKSWITTLFTGDPPSFIEIGAELEGLGQGLSDFSKKITGSGEGGKPFNAEEVKSAVSVVDSVATVLQDLNTKLPKVGGLAKGVDTLLHGRDTDLKDVGDQIGKMGEGLAAFSTSISGKMGNAEDMKTALGVVDNVIALMADVARMDEVYYNFGNAQYYVEDMNNFINSLMNTSEEGNIGVLDNLVVMMRRVSQAITEADGIDTSSLQIFSTFTESLTHLAGLKMDEIAKNFETVGENIALGTQRGIAKGSSTAIQAAVDMAVAAYESACNTLGIKSPSRVFAEAGNFIAMGMANGITDSTALVETSAENMGEAAVNGTAGVLGVISRVLAEGLDTNPTITPVLDLSQVRRGMNDLGIGDYGGTIGIQTAGIASRAGRIGSGAVPVENQNGSDYSGIYEHMAQLGTQIHEMGKAISNMKLVLDSGVVAGGVTDGVDMNLGRRIFYANRKN